MIAVCETPFYGVAGLLKRVSDIVLAHADPGADLAVMLAIALAVKLLRPAR